MHAADDLSLRETEAQKVAQKIISDFLALTPDNYTEAAYLSCARAIVLAHGRAIARRKEHWKSALKAAQVERQQSIEQMRESSQKSAWLLTFVWKIMPPAVLVMTGIVVAQSSSHMPEDATRTITWLISLVVGGLFAIVGRLVGMWFRDMRRNAIEVRFNSELFRAHILYEEGKAEEHQYYRMRMCEAWEQYAGEEFQKTASYQMVMAGDIEMRKRIERERQNYNRTTFWIMMRLARILRGGRKGEREEETVPQRPALREL
jgi:hypothetical protein